MLGWFKRKKEKTGETPVTEILDRDESVVAEPEIEPKQEKPPASDKSETRPDTAVTNEESDIAESSPETKGAQCLPETSVGSVTSEHKNEPAPSIIKRLSERLFQTRASFTGRIDELFLGRKQIDAALFEELEEILVTADLGLATTQELLEAARKEVKRDSLSDPLLLKSIIKKQLRHYIGTHNATAALAMPKEGPFVIMVVGVNGVGKTTTIGKIARKFLQSNHTVLLVAADTFRAAAAAQLKIWGERNDIRVVARQEGADPSSVVFDAMDIAASTQYDVILVDTAGRLHTKANLMEELKKIKRVMAKRIEGAPHEVLLVIDATTGQNGISQATLFNEAVGVTGIALTKLDGTAKGGIIANISRKLNIPIRFIGVGEQLDDLRDFDADEFVEALFDSPPSTTSGTIQQRTDS